MLNNEVKKSIVDIQSSLFDIVYSTLENAPPSLPTGLVGETFTSCREASSA